MGILRVSLHFHGVDSCLSPRRTLLHKDDGHGSQYDDDPTEERKCPAFSHRTDDGIYDSGCASSDQASGKVELSWKGIKAEQPQDPES